MTTSDHPTDGADLRPGTQFDRLSRRTGRLHVQHCLDCASAIYPPRVLCHRCGSTSLEWRPVDGDGVVYSVTEVRSRNGGGHAVALVDLPEGFRMMATVPLSTAIGSAVRVADLGGEDEVVVSFAVVEEAVSA